MVRRIGRVGGGQIGGQRLVYSQSTAGSKGHSLRYAVQPGGDRGAPANRSGFACQDEEGRLKCVFGILRVTKDSPADAVYEWPVSPDDRFERRLVPPVGESAEQFHIGNAAYGRSSDPAKVAKEMLQRLVGHRISPNSTAARIEPGCASRIHFFDRGRTGFGGRAVSLQHRGFNGALEFIGRSRRGSHRQGGAGSPDAGGDWQDIVEGSTIGIVGPVRFFLGPSAPPRLD